MWRRYKQEDVKKKILANFSVPLMWSDKAKYFENANSRYFQWIILLKG